MIMKIEYRFVLLTYALMIIGWGGTALSGVFGLTLDNSPWLYVFYLMGGWSPTIASYYLSKKQGRITGLKDWLKQIFAFKESILYYGLVFVFLICYFLPLCMISGFTREVPLYYIFLMFPTMLVGGGLEETGWRYLLQPKLEQTFNFFTSNILTGIIWAVWHLPLFYIAGTAQYHGNFFIFFIIILASSFALGAIRSVTKNVWLCILFHTLANVLQSVFVIKETLLGTAVTAVLMIIISILIKKMMSQKEAL